MGNFIKLQGVLIMNKYKIIITGDKSDCCITTNYINVVNNNRIEFIKELRRCWCGYFDDLGLSTYNRIANFLVSYDAYMVHVTSETVYTLSL